MMVKDMATSEFDFFQLEEVSNETAEAISGGVEITGGIKIDPLNDAAFPVDLLGKVIGSFGELTALLGLPNITELGLPDISSLPLPSLPYGGE